MRRDYGRYFEEKLNWWFVAGQFLYYKDPIHGLAVTFAPVLYDVIDFLYNDNNNSMYEELRIQENAVSIPGIVESDKKETIDMISKQKEGLLYYDWDTVLLYIIANKEQFENKVPPEVMFFINFKSKILTLRDKITKTLPKEQIVDISKLNSVFEKLKEFNITEQHWISRVFKNHYKGSCYDILFSPLFTLVNIGTDISRNIKEISDILYTLDGIADAYTNHNVVRRSILVILKERVRTMDEIGYIALEAILETKPTEHVTTNINDALMCKGIPPKHRYLLSDALYWMGAHGALTGTHHIYDETNNVVQLFMAWQPIGIKTLIDYPF